LAKLAFIFSM
jgi:hypothetical protein